MFVLKKIKTKEDPSIIMTTATHAKEPVAPPSRLLLLAEARALWETGAGIAMWPLLQLTPRGDGHPVLVLPGLVAGDGSTLLLRRYLCSRGYDAHGWGLGRNFGPREGVEDGMVELLKTLHDNSGQKVSVIGWSLGRRVCTRLLASSYAPMIRNVITLGSPFSGSPRATNAWRVYEGVSGQSSHDPRAHEVRAAHATRADHFDLQPYRRWSSHGAAASRRPARSRRTSKSLPATWGWVRTRSALCGGRPAGAAGGRVEALQSRGAGAAGLSGP